ncbi:MAG TPA: DNA polymerase III subunit beta [Gaiellaceae bacterium]|nr:DNA polymerase III subunit beta [Gaiellaceae bacterium]
MRLVCERDAVAEVLANVSRAANPRGPINVLAGVRMQANVDHVVLSATDTELSIRASMPARVDEDGVGVVPARTLAELVKKLPEGPLALAAGDRSDVRVVSGDGEYSLNALSADDFPELPTPSPCAPVRVERAAILRAFGRVGRAAARDTSRPLYTGVLVGSEGGLLTMAASDGYRLAFIRSRTTSEDIAPTLIPARVLAELTRLSPASEWVELVVGANVIQFESGEYRLTARRLNGQPQPYESLVDADFAHEVSADRERLVAAVERVGVLLGRGSPVVLDFEPDALRVRGATADLGQAVERIPVRGPAAAITIGFNPTYVIEGLRLLEGAEITFRMNDALRPVVLASTGDDLVYLLAPVRRPGAWKDSDD